MEINCFTSGNYLRLKMNIHLFRWLCSLLLLLLHTTSSWSIRCSRSVWMLCWGTWFSGNHWWRVNGWTGWSCGSFPTLAILWFYTTTFWWRCWVELCAAPWSEALLNSVQTLKSRMGSAFLIIGLKCFHLLEQFSLGGVSFGYLCLKQN